MKKEFGQALTESLVILPVFFLLLCGVLGIFQLQLASYTNDSAADVISYSDVYFESDLLKNAGWDQVVYEGKEVPQSLKDLTDAALHANHAFSSSANLENCDGESSGYAETLTSGDGGALPTSQLSTCVGLNGYESADANFHYKDQGLLVSTSKAQDQNVEDMNVHLLKTAQQNREMDSVFYPMIDTRTDALTDTNTRFSFAAQDDLLFQDFSNTDILEGIHAAAWSQKGHRATYEWKSQPMALSGYGGLFSFEYAQVFMSEDSASKFNGQCFEAPFSDSGCQAKTMVSHKFSRLAYESAYSQMALCYSEASGYCKIVAAACLLAYQGCYDTCMAGQAALIYSAYLTGNQQLVNGVTCPHTVTSLTHWERVTLSAMDSAATDDENQELQLRAGL